MLLFSHTVFASCFCNFLMFVTPYAASACLCVYISTAYANLSLDPSQDWKWGYLGPRLYADPIQWYMCAPWLEVIMFTAWIACMWFHVRYSASTMKVQNHNHAWVMKSVCITLSTLRQQND